MKVWRDSAPLADLEGDKGNGPISQANNIVVGDAPLLDVQEVGGY